MIDLAGEAGLTNAYKRYLFSRLRVELKPGVYTTYLDGVDGVGLRHPHAAQQAIHFTPWRYFVAPGGRRGGKTISAAAETLAEMSRPGARCWIVAPTYDLTDRIFQYLWQWIILDQVFGDDAVARKQFTRDSRYIETKWGSFVRGKSAESGTNIGEKLDFLAIDEAARMAERTFTEELEATLLDRQGRALLISTPRGQNWFYDYFQRRLDAVYVKQGWAGYTFKTSDNPFIPEEEVTRLRASTPPDIYEREYEASFTHFTGLIFPHYRDCLYNPDRPGDGGHLFDPKETPIPYGTDYRSIDVGWRHPTACLWGRAARSHDDVWVYREYVSDPSINHEEHARVIASRSGGMKIFDTYISPDAARRHAVRADGPETVSIMDVYEENGIQTRAADNNVEVGISIVGAYMNATLQDAPVHPRLFISKDCPRLREAIPQYVWHEPARHSELSAPEKPRKYKDDEVDALRYLLATSPSFVPDYALMGREGDSGFDEDEFYAIRYGHPRRYGKRSELNVRRRPHVMGQN